MLFNKSDAQYFEIPGGTKGYLYPPDDQKQQSIAEVEMDGVYPLEGYSINDFCTETIFMQEGGFVLEIDGQEINLKKGDVYAIPPKNEYRLWGKGKSIDVITPAWDKAQNHIMNESEYKMLFANAKEADMLYALGVFVADPVYYLSTPKKNYVLLDHREIGVFQEKNKNNVQARLLNPYLEKAKQLSDNAPAIYKVGYLILEDLDLLSVTWQIPSNFPTGLADYLRSRNIKLNIQQQLFPERRKKSGAELSVIRNIMKRLTLAFVRIEEILQISKIEGDLIKYNGEALTSEILKQEVNQVLIANNLIDTEGMIISCGEQAAMPHHPGAGILRPNQTIICDIFPRDIASGYYGDMTRTYVKGAPSESVQKMFEAVKSAQESAIDLVQAGKSGKDIYNCICTNFISKGFEVSSRGFIHGLGHGLGLDLHETPFLNSVSNDILQTGDVFSIEPGLYYPEFGGVRIEDIIAITENGVENLTKYPKIFIIE